MVANTNGASANCDASGQCDCIANTYGTTCISCDCNTGGTESGSGACGSSGVCTCKEGISIIICQTLYSVFNHSSLKVILEISVICVLQCISMMEIQLHPLVCVSITHLIYAHIQIDSLE